MTPVRAPQARTPTIRLSELDERIIRAVGAYKFMTTLDLWHLLGNASQSHLRERLRYLSGADQVAGKRSEGDQVPGQYLFRFSLRSAGKGEKPRVYCLGVKGRHASGQDDYYRPAKTLSLSYGYLAHALCLTRFCVAAAAFCRTNSAFSLAELQLCYGLARNPPRVTLDANGKKKDVAVIPDALLWFVRSDGEELAVLLEVDRGTSGSRRVKAGLRARIELLRSGEYRRFLKPEAVRIAYLTTAGEARRDALELWAYEVIAEAISEEKHREGWLEKFFFTSKAYEALFDPALFTDPVWQCPAFETTVALLPPLPPTNKETTHGHTPETTGPGKAPAPLCYQTSASRNCAE